MTADVRTGLGASALQRSIVDKLTYVQGRLPSLATRNDWYMALAHAVRDSLLHRWVKTVETYSEQDVKVVAYLSAEFLIGPHLGNNLASLGIEQAAREAVTELGLDLDELLEQEEPGLGNGGLGRLAACFLDSLATLGIPAIGYGIRYEFGIFDQEIRDGWQVEVTDKWLRYGNPWEIARPEIAYEIAFGGHTEPYRDEQGRYRVRWVPHRVVKGIPYDTPIAGYPAARWRRHILDESAGHGVCGQHGTVAVERLTWGSLAASVGMGSVVVDHIRETEVGPRRDCEVAHEPGVVSKRGVMPRDPSPGCGRGRPTPKGRGRCERARHGG
jgi:glucan phosphorylase